MHKKTLGRSRATTSPVALLFPPPILHGRYAVERVVGHGSFGRVSRAWDRQQGQPVALKCAYPQSSAEELLKAEARILADLHHPAIPALVEAFEEEGRCYLAQEWRAGTPLWQWTNFSLPRVLWLGRQCVAVLTYLHQRHLVHRDLMPGNILLGVRSFTLLDFGFARPCDAPAWSCGTPGYAAPEQWTKGTVSPAADIYSLGMLLICALLDCGPDEILSPRTFAALRQQAQARFLPTALHPLLALLECMIATTPARRPTLATIAHTLRQLSLAPAHR